MRIVPFGDAALTVALEPRIEPSTLARVAALDRALSALPGVRETVPAYASLLVRYDPRFVQFDDIAAAARAADLGETPASPGATHVVPVAYGGMDGPDLGDVARWAGMSEARVIQAHADAEYLVYMIGFTPGFPYLGTVEESIAAPRMQRPRTRVPAGSVGIARRQTGIYPSATPGGWRLIGRTTLPMFDPHAFSPSRFTAGDRVRFAPVSADALPETEASDASRNGHAVASSPAFAVVHPGAFSTVQDAGRDGARRFGVPPSGALDAGALASANAAVGNEVGAAALEFVWPAPVLTALAHCDVAVAGADFGAEIDGAAVRSDPRTGVGVAAMRRGQTVRFRAWRRGTWGVMAVAGGFAVASVLGSASTLVRSAFGGHEGRTLRTGDVLRAGRSRSPVSFGGTVLDRDRPIRVMSGPHADHFRPDALSRFVEGAYRVSARRDRSGYRLEGDPVAHAGAGEILSEGMLPGAIEVPPDGQPIVLMPDGPVTGGYPVLAVVAAADLGVLAQLPPGTVPRFVMV